MTETEQRMRDALGQLGEDAPWWHSSVPEKERADRVMKTVSRLEERQRNIHVRNLQNAWLYDRSLLEGSGVWALSGPVLSQDVPYSENYIQAIVDTAVASVASQRPRAVFQTFGAGFRIQRRARRLERYIEGEFQRLDLYRVLKDVFRDACVFGLGALKVFEEGVVGEDGKLQDPRPAVRRILPDDLVVDLLATSTDGPREVHERHFVDAWTLAAQFPTHAPQIRDAAASGDCSKWTSYRRPNPGEVVVVESWRLPTRLPGGKAGEDGRHVISVHGNVLVDEPWKRFDLPFVFTRWIPRLVGFYGRGLGETLAPQQSRHDGLHRFAQRCQDLIALPRVYLPASDAQAGVRIDNRIGAIVTTRSGRPPTFMTPPAVPQEIYNTLERIPTGMHRIAGMSELATSSRKPAGIESAPALREFANFQDARFAIQFQEFEAAVLAVARALVASSKRCAQCGAKDLGTTYVSRWASEEIKWAEVDLETDRYSMSIEAGNILSRTPAGRLQAVSELAATGLFDQRVLLRMLDLPDTKREIDMETAAVEDIERTIEYLLDEKWRPPDPHQDLALGIRRVQQEYLRWNYPEDDGGAPEEILDMMRQWIEQAQDLLAAAAPAPPAPMGGGALSPMQNGPLAGIAPPGVMAPPPGAIAA